MKTSNYVNKNIFNAQSKKVNVLFITLFPKVL